MKAHQTILFLTVLGICQAMTASETTESISPYEKKQFQQKTFKAPMLFTTDLCVKDCTFAGRLTVHGLLQARGCTFNDTVVIDSDRTDAVNLIEFIDCKAKNIIIKSGWRKTMAVWFLLQEDSIALQNTTADAIIFESKGGLAWISGGDIKNIAGGDGRNISENID